MGEMLNIISLGAGVQSSTMALMAAHGCPYHDPATWRGAKANNPEWWEDAVYVDNAIRHQVGNEQGEMFISRTLTPLASADLLSFLDECDGMCGV